ncbi:MAG: ribonuclease HII [Bacteroidetes bacterium]|nr:MAG: ribonuclease HII [Bacteroidota bacterium]
MLQLYLNPTLIEVGCDEAGRGAMAGPVAAAAVILDPHKPIAGLNDSKKLSPKRREALAQEIKEKATAWAVAMIPPEKIDEINILNAAILAMHKALDQLPPTFQHILVDGNRFHPYPNIPHTCIVKGDTKFQSIAAASILAKTARDAQMCRLKEAYPQYGWENNKGYATQAHIAAMKKHGQSPWHRKTFRLHQQLRIPF